ncbi:MAG: acyloxyacyl hydrolase [Saprospiraceae bacterium]|nr:acyloxyacyl hydrolase [Saprospiraceae bacterium]
MNPCAPLQPTRSAWWMTQLRDLRQQLPLLSVAPCVLLLLLFSSTVRTQSPPIYSIGAHGGFIIAHSPEVQNTRGARPTGVEAGLGFADRSEQTYAICRCSTESGVNAQYIDFDNSILGKAAALSYYFEPQFALSPSCQLGVRALCGGIYLSNPFHPQHNPANQSYSTHLSFFLGLGAGFRYRISPKLHTGLAVLFLHTSNGGLKEPNKGVNWPVLQLQLQYVPSGAEPPRGNAGEMQQTRSTGVSACAFYSNKLVAHGDKRRYSVYGVAAEAFTQLSSVSGLLAGMELYMDLSVKEKLARQGQSIDHQPGVGIAAGHVFFLGRMQFSQQLGVYVLKANPSFDRIYHRWTLTYRHRHHWLVGFSLKAHRHVADFADLRLGYRWQRVKDRKENP